MSGTDTIFALASAPGRAGIAVFRLSGTYAGEALKRLSRSDNLPPPRQATRVKLQAINGDELIDDGMVLWFAAPASFTGEDVVELHLHGGRAVFEAMTQNLLEMGLRPAEPGEFSRRAFHNRKMDLTQAEAIADLVDAETSAQRRQALAQMGGALARLAEGWRERMLRARAHLEAEIDFAEEGLPEALGHEARGRLRALADEMATHLADSRRGERLRDGFQIAILGAPNVGKSSLINALAGRDVAIVASEAGTTRDVVEVHLDLGGYLVTLADTAGLREAMGEIEAEGIRRSRVRAKNADLRLVVFDATQLDPPDAESLALLGDGAITLINKSDLAPNAFLAGQKSIALSTQSGIGLDKLLKEIDYFVSATLDQRSAAPLTRARHRAAVTEAEIALRRALESKLPELAAEDVRVASDALGRITGRVDVEEMLDVIFREFCIGK